jgi:hypothetical protein
MSADDFFPRVRLGIPKPDKLPDTSQNMDAMRLAIHKAAREAPLIRQALNSALHTGASGEDTYVLLAYKALLELERLYQQIEGHLECNIKYPEVVLECTCPKIEGATRNMHDHNEGCPISTWVKP